MATLAMILLFLALVSDVATLANGSGGPTPGAPLLWPANVSAFFTNPGRPTTLTWTVEAPPTTAATALRYAVSGYSGTTSPRR